MKLKKILISILVLAVVLAFAGCGGSSGNRPDKDDKVSSENTDSNNKNEPVTIKLAIMGEGQNKENTQKILDKFNQENPDIKAEVQYVPVTSGSGWNDFFTKIKTMVAGGNPPDLAFVAIEGIQMFVNLGLAVPLDEYFDKNPEQLKEAKDDIHPKLQAPFIVNGKTYALVCEWNNVVLHMNTKLLEDAGLELPPQDWDKDMFLDYCSKLTKTEGGQKQYAVAVPAYYFGFSSWLFNNNASVLNEDMTKCTLNQPNSVEMFQFWQDMVNKYEYAAMPEPGVDDIQRLVDGQIAMGSWGRWPTLTYINNDFKDAAVQYLPKFKSKNVIYGSGGFCVINGTKHPYEAMKTAVWTAGEYFVKNYYSAGSIPCRKSVAEEVIPKLGIPENHELYYKSADYAKPVESPPAYAEIANVFDRYLSAVLTNEMSAQEAMDKATEEIDNVLEQSPIK